MRKIWFKRSIFLIVVFFVGIYCSAEEKENEKKNELKYLSSTSFSFLLTGGNNKDQTFSFDTDQNLVFGKNQLSAKLNIISTRKESQNRSEILNAQLKYNYKINSGAYILGFLAAERNKLAGNEFRFAYAVGAGFVVIKKKKFEMSTEISLGRTTESLKKISQLKSFAAYLSLNGSNKIIVDFSKNSQFIHHDLVFFNFKNIKDWRIDSNTSLSASISRNFALKISFRLIYDNEPVEGFKTTDYFFLNSLVVKF